MPPSRTHQRAPNSPSLTHPPAPPSSAAKPSHQPTSASSNGPHAHSGIEGMSWSSTPTSTLHRYRLAYGLPVPSTTAHSYNALVLGTATGRKTPSRCKRSKRLDKEALARAVRKDFNAMPINESEVIVRFLYSVKMQDRHFRMRFAPEGRRATTGSATTTAGGTHGSGEGGGH